jgi:hypothetical protein
MEEIDLHKEFNFLISSIEEKILLFRKLTQNK